MICLHKKNLSIESFCGGVTKIYFCDVGRNKFEFTRRNTITSLLHRDTGELTTGGTEAATQQTLSGQFLVTFQHTKNMHVSSSIF